MDDSIDILHRPQRNAEIAEIADNLLVLFVSVGGRANIEEPQRRVIRGEPVAERGADGTRRPGDEKTRHPPVGP